MNPAKRKKMFRIEQLLESDTVTEQKVELKEDKKEEVVVVEPVAVVEPAVELAPVVKKTKKTV